MTPPPFPFKGFINAEDGFISRSMLEVECAVTLGVPSGHRVTLDLRLRRCPGPGRKAAGNVRPGGHSENCRRAVKVLLHLLSPARKPVQVTQDLKGFWNSGYKQGEKGVERPVCETSLAG